MIQKKIQGARISIYPEQDLWLLYEEAAKTFLELLRSKPNSLILLPTGATPEPFYAAVLKAFGGDPSLDFSQAQFFNLDEYEGLPPGHPLSYATYMQILFYGPLRALDPRRAPAEQNCRLPTDSDFAERLKEIDLAILGMGGAYPAQTAQGTELRGGHVAFNEPGSLVLGGVSSVELSDQTRKDTSFRFSSLKHQVAAGRYAKDLPTEIPKRALTVGLSTLLGAREILVLATGESKGQVIDHVFHSPGVEARFPAQYLLRHPKTHWLLDEFAGASLVTDSNSKPTTKTLVAMPRGKRILVLSPHPDDDVICMGSTLVKLQEQKNEIQILYAVSGVNAVPGELSEEKKSAIRKKEAQDAVRSLGLDASALTFFEAHYYHRRGIPGLPPLESEEITRFAELLRKWSPEIIFFSAENDPYGAHGLSSKLLARACIEWGEKPQFFGYRGAYNEWRVDGYGEYLVYPFDEETMAKKVKAIQLHRSQLDAMFPSFDPRPFWQRAKERNKNSARIWGVGTYLEVFKKFSYSEFLKQVGI